MAEQFRIGDLRIFAVGDGQCFVERSGGGPPLVLPESDARLLANCGEYRSLEGHAGAWAALLDRKKIAQVEQRSPRWLSRVLDAGAKAVEPSPKLIAQTQQTLSHLAEQRGLLVSRSSFVRDLLSHGHPDPAEPISALAFTTRNRTSELRRALDSYAANFALHGRSPEILIVDDSRRPASEAETEQMLRDFQRTSGLPVRFAGLAERETYAAALAREARVHPAVARFALLGDERCSITTGSARNSVLLDCASTRYVLADDDGVCRLVRAPGAEEGLDVVSQNDPTQLWFFENRDALHADVAFTAEPDLFALHESLLGRPAGCALENADFDLSGATAAFDARLRRLGGAVRTTMAGVAGDSGIAATAYLTVEARSRSRLTISEGFYHAAVASRQMLRAPQRACISEGFLTMAGNLGIDAAALFPPFTPVLRNSDGMLGRLLQQCFSNSCRGYLDWAVLHDPTGVRSQSLDDWFEEIRRIRFVEVLTAFERDRLEVNGDDPAEALEVLGARFARLGQARPEDFRRELQERVTQREAARISQLRRNASDDAPAFYQALQKRYTDVVQEAVTHEDFLLPRDLPGEPLALTQSLVGRMGAMLSAWPRLWNAALWMRTNGTRLSRPLS